MLLQLTGSNSSLVSIFLLFEYGHFPLQHRFQLLQQESVAVGDWANGIYFYRVFGSAGRLLSSGQVVVSH